MEIPREGSVVKITKRKLGLIPRGRQNIGGILVGGILILSSLFASCAGPAPTPTPTATSTPTPAVTSTATSTLTPTPEVTEKPTPTHEAMVMDEPTPAATPTPTRVFVEGELVSDIVDFVLQDLTIEVGTKVIWTNNDVSPHTATSGQPDGITGTWDSGSLGTGSSFSFDFNQTGTFLYFCTIHPSIMQASVTVVESLPGGPIVTTPVPTPRPTPTPTSEAIEERGAVQEIGIIENYAATRFFPQWLVVVKDIPVRLFLTRLHREHVNKFSIAPFFSSSEVILPGEVGVIEFLPNEVGEFKIQNVGHNFEATLVVVNTKEEAKERIVERGVQMYSFIHSLEDFRIFPDRLVVEKGIPVRLHNISLAAEHRVSFEPFHAPEDINVKPGEISILEFTPDRTGEFTIRHETHGITGELVVEE